uniref:PSQ10.8c n=1 Tax=Nocardiopsis sp. 90127 TaxID=373213 RepID=Q27I80_9ACTN|nr:hypothetical protein [Nocardiopsis sp. 90127]ABD48731.1 pSQ10.8c [Nocardiopsis sp. 90127]
MTAGRGSDAPIDLQGDEVRTTMMPPPAATETAAWLAEITPDTLTALDITDAGDLFAQELEGESPEEAGARLAAAADILDDRLTEIAHTTLTPEVLRRWSA